MAAGLSPNCHMPTPWRRHTPLVLKKLPGAARNPSGGLLLAVIYDHSHRFVKSRPAACNFKNPPMSKTGSRQFHIVTIVLGFNSNVLS